MPGHRRQDAAAAVEGVGMFESLVGSEPFFDGARPLDVLVRRGVTPLIEALAAIEADGYA